MARSLLYALVALTLTAVPLFGPGVAVARAVDGEPVMTIQNVEITPDPLGDPEDGSHDVLQHVSWSNFPAGSQPKFYYPQATGGKGLPIQSAPFVYTCQGGGGGYVGECNNGPFPTEGSVDIHYRPSEVSADYAHSGSYSERLQFWIDDAGPRFTGTITVKPIADLILDVATPDQNTITMTVHNHGPSHAGRSTLKIGGFAQALTLTGNSGCTAGADKTVNCTIDPVGASRDTGTTCNPGSGSLPTCDRFILTMNPDWTRTRLTVSIVGPTTPDPDNSSNTSIAFPDAPLAADVTAGPGPIVVAPANTAGSAKPPKTVSTSPTADPSASTALTATEPAPTTSSNFGDHAASAAGTTRGDPVATAARGGLSVTAALAALVPIVVAGALLASVLVWRSRRGRVNESPTAYPAASTAPVISAVDAAPALPRPHHAASDPPGTSSVNTP